MSGDGGALPYFGPLSERSIGDKPIRVIGISGREDLPSCDVLFIPSGMDAGTVRLLQEAAAGDILIFGESEGFLERGGMVNFYLESGSVKFAIHVSNMEKKGFKMSSRVLALAKVVRAEH